MARMFKELLRNMLIGILPTAYYLTGIFLLTLTGMHVFYTITAFKVIMFIVSVKIITIEFALTSYLYKDRKERLMSFIINTILLVLGLTIFST